MAGPQGHGQPVDGKFVVWWRQEEAGLQVVEKLVVPWLQLLGHEKLQLVGQPPWLLGAVGPLDVHVVGLIEDHERLWCRNQSGLFEKRKM